MLVPLLVLGISLPFAAARPASYAVWAADSAISRGQGNGLSSGSATVSYEHGEFQYALTLLYAKTGNSTYYNYIKSGVDNIISSSGVVGGDYKYVHLKYSTNPCILTTAPHRKSDYSLDPVRVGPSFLYLWVTV
jgi:rhamnogalacturonyl hydrolase YesR